jgi:myo-inositol-hexaphosphate 3-phosphohydrolase
LVRELEKFDLGGEPNLGILERQDRSALLLVTNDQDVFVLRTGDYEIVDQFEPDLESIETVLGDSFYQAVYVPDENDRQGVYAFSPDGRDFFKCDPVGTCTDVFGSSVFDDDAEGILLYSCPSDSQPDGGSGYIVVSDQIGSQTQFEIFDRETWRHLGALELDGVAKTDGIASTQTALPGYPLGIFAAVDDDKSTAIVGWDKIFEATGLGCVD